MTIEKLPQQAADANVPQNDALISMIERVVMSPDLPMDRITALIDIRERQMAKEAEQAFNASFAAAMGEMQDVGRSGFNTHLKRKYSTLDDLIRTARPVLARHGLSLNWQTGVSGDGIWVRAVVRHALGHSIETEQSAARDKSGSMNTLQGGGSTETYLKRYTGFAILGLSSGDEQDDDGRGGAETITAEQFQALRELIEKAGADEDKLCQFFRVDVLGELPAAKYGAADAMLRKKIAAKGGDA